jgi:outer membrane protein OmpA-like peptidoglycan-associated protein
LLTIDDIGCMLDQLHLTASPATGFILRPSSQSRHLRVLEGVAPCLLYHERHPHRMVPSCVLHPDTELFSRQCSSCFWIESTYCSPDSTRHTSRGKTLEFVCPECAVFICSECCRRGNGVIGSVQARQLALNSEVLFQPGTSALQEETGGMLTQVGRFLLDNAIPIRIEGHINTVQSSGKVLPATSSQIKVLEEGCDGQTLSERRAVMVGHFLQRMGVDAGQIHTVGWGGSRPLSTEKVKLDRNRYVFHIACFNIEIVCSLDYAAYVCFSRVEFHFVFSDCRPSSSRHMPALTVDNKIDLQSEVLFEPGSSTLSNESYGLLERVAGLLQGSSLPIRIEGHINTVQKTGRILPASSPLIRVMEPGCNGQELSERRAKTVSKHLKALGVDSKLLHPVGCGGSRPLTRESTDLNLNRYLQ